MPDITATTISWDARLPLDIALNLSSVTQRQLYSDEDLIERYGLSKEQLDAIQQLPAFRKDVLDARHELAANGLTIKRKATALFEYYLDTSVPEMMGGTYTDPKTKLEIIKFLGQVAGKDGKAELAAEQVAQIPTLNITLQTAPERTERVLEHVIDS